MEKPTDTDWIIKAMVAVAAADDRLNAREVDLIEKAFRAQTGRAADVSGISLAVQAYATKRNVIAELSVASGSLSQQTKEEIIRAAYLMLLVDNRLAEDEFKKVKDIAAALRISEDRFDSIVEEAKLDSAQGRGWRGSHA